MFNFISTGFAKARNYFSRPVYQEEKRELSENIKSFEKVFDLTNDTLEIELGLREINRWKLSLYEQKYISERLAEKAEIIRSAYPAEEYRYYNHLANKLEEKSMLGFKKSSWTREIVKSAVRGNILKPIAKPENMGIFLEAVLTK